MRHAITATIEPSALHLSIHAHIAVNTKLVIVIAIVIITIVDVTVVNVA